jgi:phosphoenolpyruvate carboxykinase (GTP)
MTTTASPTHTEAAAPAVAKEPLEAEARYDLTGAPTRHAGLLAWVAEVAALTQPDRIHWVDGSDAEYAKLTDELIAAGTMVRLNDEKKPNSFWVRTDPSDVARVEQRTFICSTDEADAGPTTGSIRPR